MTPENQNSYPDISQSWGIVGIAILCMIVFIPINLLLNSIGGEEISFLIYYVLATGAAFWIAHSKRKKWTGASEYSLELSSAKIIILVSMVTLAIQTGIIAPMVDLLPMPEFIRKIFLEAATRNGIYSFIAIVIAAPILEELIFRGIILDGLLKRYSPLKSIVISSALFGIVHLNPWQFITAFIIGMFSGWVYYKTKKLTLSILIHFVNNLMAFTGMYLMKPETMEKPLSELYGGFLNLILITFGAIAVAAICLYFLRSEIKKTEINYASTQDYI